MGISADEPEDVRDFHDRLGLHFPLLSDQDLEVAHAWGVAMLGRDIAVPATIIVRKDGAIVYRRVGESVSDRPSPDEILKALRAL